MQSSLPLTAQAIWESEMDTVVCEKCEKITHSVSKCGRCRKQKYCCKEAQVADWDRHKKICTALLKSGIKGGTVDKVYQMMPLKEMQQKFRQENLDYYGEKSGLFRELSGKKVTKIELSRIIGRCNAQFHKFINIEYTDPTKRMLFLMSEEEDIKSVYSLLGF
jgi:hypothetical protein